MIALRDFTTRGTEMSGTAGAFGARPTGTLGRRSRDAFAAGRRLFRGERAGASGRREERALGADS